MSTTPPEQPSQQPQGYGYRPTFNLSAIMPTPGNAELAVYALVILFLVIIWAASSRVNAGEFSILLTVLTSFYLLSRGIAKASRVLER
jgi:hypothetical protein